MTLQRNVAGVFTYRATLGTSVKDASLTVSIVPGSVKSVTLNPNPVQGGSDTTGTVTLYTAAPTGGSKVTLSSSSAAIAFPALSSVTVAAGKTTATFLVHTKPTLSNARVNLTAKAPVGPAVDGVLTVLAPSLKTFTVSPTTLYGGDTVTGTLALTVPAPTGGLVVSLVTSDGEHALVPSSLTVPAGQRTLTFTVNTRDIGSGELAVKVRAIVNGIAADSTLTLVPHSFALDRLSFNPNPVKQGANAIGTLTFFGVSPSGATVEVRSSGALLKRYTAPAGVLDATVSDTLPTGLLPAGAYTVDAQLFINGKATGTAIHAKLTVNP